MRPYYLALIITAAMLSNASAGEVYKWKDKNGVIHYGEFEPPNRKSTTIETPSSKPAVTESDAEGESDEDESGEAPKPAASIDRSPENKKKMLENINEERAKKKEAKLKADDEAQAVERRCNSLKSRLAILERGGRLSESAPDGKIHYLTEDEVKARVAETRKIIAKDCKK